MIDIIPAVLTKTSARKAIATLLLTAAVGGGYFGTKEILKKYSFGVSSPFAAYSPEPTFTSIGPGLVKASCFIVDRNLEIHISWLSLVNATKNKLERTVGQNTITLLDDKAPFRTFRFVDTNVTSGKVYTYKVSYGSASLTGTNTVAIAANVDNCVSPKPALLNLRGGEKVAISNQVTLVRYDFSNFQKLLVPALKVSLIKGATVLGELVTSAPVKVEKDPSKWVFGWISGSYIDPETKATKRAEAGDDYRVRITLSDMGNVLGSDTSDIPFSLVPQPSQLSGQCSAGKLPVTLSWNRRPGATLSTLIKKDLTTGTSSNIPTGGLDSTSYEDRSLIKGHKYQYTHRNYQGIVSEPVVVALSQTGVCTITFPPTPTPTFTPTPFPSTPTPTPTPTVTPTPNPSSSPTPLSCVPGNQTVITGQNAVLSATGGNGSYSWSAPGGTITGSGSSVSIMYATTGTKLVTVQSGAQNATCTVISQ